jgi:two-component system OmpR family response regulator
VLVLVVDDHAELLSLVGSALEGDGHRAVLARSVAQAQAALAKERFDVLVLDDALPDGSGVDLCREVRGKELATPILILTAHAAIRERVRGLDAGADDFMSKPFAVAELRARVRALGRRASHAPGTSWRKDGVELDFARRRASVAGREVPLTAREWHILDLLVSSRGRVVSRARILEEVWSDDAGSAAASLDVLMARIRKKLGSDLVRTLRGEGYALS